MNTLRVVVADIVAEDSAQVILIEHDYRSAVSRLHDPTQRSATRPSLNFVQNRGRHLRLTRQAATPLPARCGDGEGLMQWAAGRERSSGEKWRASGTDG